jgi:hypothetical protein
MNSTLQIKVNPLPHEGLAGDQAEELMRSDKQSEEGICPGSLMSL